jgi:hypothetical protein
VRYDCAHDRDYSAALYDEKRKPEPDLLCIVEIEKRMDELVRERRSLHVANHEMIATIRSEYRVRIRARVTADANRDRTDCNSCCVGSVTS